MATPPIITLLTDFGLWDPYVAIMKGRILSLCPEVRMVDLTHSVPPQDIARGAYVLQQAMPYFPQGTIHLYVVDPGVGSERRPIAVRTELATFVGPDNGLLSPTLEHFGPVLEQVVLTEPEQLSRTFHGRDLFAPVAAHLAKGIPLSQLGKPFKGLVDLPQPRAELQGTTWNLNVVTVDHFGNVILNLKTEGSQNFFLREELYSVRDAVVPFCATYSEVATSEPLLLFNSENMLELACNQDSAARRWNLSAGDSLEVKRACSMNRNEE